MPEFITTAIAALIGTLTAGAVGFFFALRQFRLEKTFEHRLEWHEKTVRQLTNASEKLRKAAVSLQVKELEDDSEESCGEALAALPGVLLLLEAEMYASKESYDALVQAWHDLGELALANVQLQNTAEHHGQSQAADRIAPRIIEALAKSLLHAASRLASDVRDILRLDSLGRTGRLYDDDQVASLARRSDISALERANRIRQHRDLP